MKKQIIGLLAATAILALAAVLFVVFFRMLPIESSSLGIDWSGLWRGLQGGRLRYGTGFRNPPWSVILLLPLGLLSFEVSWGLLALATISIEVISIPRGMPRRYRLPAAFFLATSYPSLRNIADGNLELLTIAGVLLMLFAVQKVNPWLLAAGLLLASAKPQETWLLILALWLLVLRAWPTKKILEAASSLFLVVMISMAFYGRDWIEALIGIPQRGSVMDSSLISSLTRLEFPITARWVVWFAILIPTLYLAYITWPRVNRSKAGFLMAASLLLAPYAAANSLLAITAIGIVPLFETDRKAAVALGVLVNLPYLILFQKQVRFWYGALIALAILIIIWAVFAWKIWKDHSQSAGSHSRI